MLTIKIQDKIGKTLAVDHGENEVNLFYTGAYNDGDLIVIEIEKPVFAWVSLDPALEKTLVYMTQNMYFDIPFEEKKICYCPASFTGDRHLITVKTANDDDVMTYRNLAFNTSDSHRDNKCYPHVYANVETRGESVFAARNAIDGITANHSHGEWPFASWGINRDPKAELTLDFGRNVTTDKIILYERADFPHDSYWTNATIEFSDGSEISCPLTKTDQGQLITFPAKEITWLKLKDLIKAEDSSPFPALTQIEVYGRG